MLDKPLTIATLNGHKLVLTALFLFQVAAKD